MTADQDLIRRLDVLIRIQAIGATKGMKQADAIGFLSKVGLDAGSIAEIVDTTPGTVRATQARLRKASGTVERTED